MALMSSKVKKIWLEKAEKPEEWILQLQDLAYDMEDFIEQRGRDPQASAPIRLLHMAMVVDPRPEHIARIDHFKDRIKRIQSSWSRDESRPTTPPTSTQEAGGNSGNNPAVSGPWAGSSAAGSSSARFSPCEQKHLGTGKSDLLELLSGDHGQQKELKVISILGCSGSGKTTLARAVYEDGSVIERFPRRAFVDVSVHDDASKILQHILTQVRRGAVHSDSIDLTRDLQECLRNKRFISLSLPPCAFRFYPNIFMFILYIYTHLGIINLISQLIN
jgi:hypothetical protein